MKIVFQTEEHFARENDDTIQQRSAVMMQRVNADYPEFRKPGKYRHVLDLQRWGYQDRYTVRYTIYEKEPIPTGGILLVVVILLIALWMIVPLSIL